MKYAIGLDNGGTAIKAVLFDASGKEIASSDCATELISNKPGYMERDMEVMWQANCQCIRNVIEKSKVDPMDIEVISLSGHGKGLYLWGNDKPVRNGILSSDTRTLPYLEKWQEEGIEDLLFDKILQTLHTGQPALLLAWLKEYEKEKYNSIQYIFSAKDYIRFRLTNKAYSEITDLSGSGLFNVKEKFLDDSILKAFHIDEIIDKIPPICDTFHICGKITPEASKLTGLMEGTKVSAGMFDVDACAIAMDITSSENICCVNGTWSVNEYIAKSPVLKKGIKNSLYVQDGYYLIEESSATGAGNLSWVLNTIFDSSMFSSSQEMYAYVNETVSSISPESCDVYYLPYLYGSNVNPNAKAGFVGLDAYHNKGHMLRAVYEGIVYSMKIHVDRLLASRQKPKAIRLAGGITKSSVWIQMVADILDMPIETITSTTELGALGCVITGFVSIGEYSSLKEATQQMVSISNTVYPNTERVSIYKKKYKKYCALVDALDSFWKAE